MNVSPSALRRRTTKGREDCAVSTVETRRKAEKGERTGGCGSHAIVVDEDLRRRRVLIGNKNPR